MQLSSQAIREHCVRTDPLALPFRWHQEAGKAVPMISPFSSDRVVIRGRSAGLSAATYDCRIAANVTLGVNPAFTLARALRELTPDKSPGVMLWKLREAAIDSLRTPPYALANTLEDFAMPDGVCGYVVDKSSHARLFVSAFNTFMDPGWRGNLTLELVNLSDREVVLQSGDPICQIAFHFLDRATDRPYTGKYMNQSKWPVEAIFEGAE